MLKSKIYFDCHPELVEGQLIIKRLKLRQAQFDKHKRLLNRFL